MEPVRRTVLADEATALLRNEILMGRLEAGAKLAETELAQSLQVSRAPVREALMRLQQQGLVTSERYRGTAVVELTESDVEELVTLRSVLEPLAWSRAAAVATDDDLAALDDIVDRMRKSVVSDEHAGLVLLDVEFHDRVFQAAAHGRLYAAWSAISYQVALYLLRRRMVTDDYHRIIVDEHQELVNVLRARDRSAAMAAIATHITQAYDRLTQNESSARE